MFARVAAFELRYQLRNPILWVAFLAIFAVTFAATISENGGISGIGEARINSPHALIRSIAVIAMVAQLAVVAFVAGAVVRDFETGFAPIILTTRIRKLDYLYGRFLGAFGAGVVVLCAVPLAIFACTLMPGVNPDRVGPLVLWHYLYAFAFAGLPTLFICSSLFFALATVTRSMIASYVGLIAFVALYVVLAGAFNRPGLEDMAAVLDLYGIGALTQETRYWTLAERNTLVQPVSEIYLANRGLWCGLAAAALASTYFLFNPAVGGLRAAAKRGRQRDLEPDMPGVVATPLPAARRSVGVQALLVQLLARARFEAAYVLGSPVYLVMVAIGLFVAAGDLWLMDRVNDMPVYPVTRLMTRTLNASFEVFPILIASYYAGELIWRDREKRVHEFIAATPTPDWTFVSTKVLALMLVLATTIALSATLAISVQLIKGFYDIRLAEYALWYALPALVSAFTITALAVFAQVLSPHKFVGWGVMALYLIGSAELGSMGFDHALYLYGRAPPVLHSDMNGQGHYWIGAAWFQTYWSIGALLLLVLACLLNSRGADVRIVPRLKALPRRLAGTAGVLASVLVAVFVGLGGWIYYNTNVLNEYRTADAHERWLVDMEQALRQYADAPQPKISDVAFRVDLYPRELRAEISGVYTIVNRTEAPLSEVHLHWPRDLDLGEVEVDDAVLARDFTAGAQAFPFQVWRFTRLMQPGDTREIRFAGTLDRDAFRTVDILSQVNYNATFLRDREFAPFVGLDRDRFLHDRRARARYGLQPLVEWAPLEDDSARAFNYFRHDSDWVNADITVSTTADQTPIAPGRLVQETVAHGRRTAHFRTEAPILNFFSIQSARYDLRREAWNGVDLDVYFNTRHPYNVDRMLRAMRASLDVYTREFGPYPYNQLRIVEFPAYHGEFAQAFAGTVAYSEAMGFIYRFPDLGSPGLVDEFTFTTAHEVAHQWWSYQLTGADMQGGTMLSETLAEYSALLVMEEMYGRDLVRQLLRSELDSYLRARGGQSAGEQPLVRVENQAYLHYHKGAFVMYFLRSEIGNAAMNRALRRVLSQYAFRGAPYARSIDLVNILREEAGPAFDQLITDLFERVTLYEVRAVSGTTRAVSDGRWEVNLIVEARKLYADGEGVETEVPLDEVFEIGVFSSEASRGSSDSAGAIAIERRRVHSGRQTITLLVDREPRFAGIDPNGTRIDRRSDDNLVALSWR